MGRLVDITADQLREALEEVEGSKPGQRLFAALAYKHGVTQSELAEWFDVERKTIYNWFTRLEEGNLESAVFDEPRAGRPRKLSGGQFAELEEALQQPPTAVGVDAPAWTTVLLQEFIRETFNIDYSQPTCRRLMQEAGLRHRTPRQAAVEVDTDDRESSERDSAGLGHVWLPR